MVTKGHQWLHEGHQAHAQFSGGQFHGCQQQRMKTVDKVSLKNTDTVCETMNSP